VEIGEALRAGAVEWHRFWDDFGLRRALRLAHHVVDDAESRLGVLAGVVTGRDQDADFPSHRASPHRSKSRHTAAEGGNGVAMHVFVARAAGLEDLFTFEVEAIDRPRRGDDAAVGMIVEHDRRLPGANSEVELEAEILRLAPEVGIEIIHPRPGLLEREDADE